MATGARVYLRHLRLAIIFLGLFLMTSGTVYSQADCSVCHNMHGGSVFLYEGSDCSVCHADVAHGAGFTVPDVHGTPVCRKCHTMHASEDGVVPTMPDESGGSPEGPNPHLLYKSDVTDLCLVCHAAPANGTGAPIVMTTNGTGYPSTSGGDFYHSGDDQGSGHNPGGMAIGTDSTLTESPGGGFDSLDETCLSCHDPHRGDSANSYRMLKTKPGDWTGSDLLVSGMPAHPGTDEGSGSGSNRPTYYSGFSAWCGACHSSPDGTGTGFHGSDKSDPDVGNGDDWLRHPSDLALGSSMVGDYGNDFNWLYPVQDVNLNGALDAGDEVFCLSCHRSHATPYNNSTRWDSAQPSGAGTGCNKCHAKG